MESRLNEGWEESEGCREVRRGRSWKAWLLKGDDADAAIPDETTAESETVDVEVLYQNTLYPPVSHALLPVVCVGKWIISTHAGS